MQSAEDLAFEIAGMRNHAVKFFVPEIIEAISARDAEWQARVDTLLEDNNRSEEQVKKQFANAVGFKARAEKAEARVDRLTAALKQYANRDNWELDEEHNTFRRWLEPDSYTPYAYNGFSIARAALADVAHMVLTTATVYTPPELVKAATEALRKAGEI